MKRFLPLVSVAFIACQNDAILSSPTHDRVALAPRLMDAQGAAPATVQSVHVQLTVGTVGSAQYMVKDTTVAWESKSLSLAVPVGQRYSLLIQGRNNDDPIGCWRWSGVKTDSIRPTDEVVMADTLFIAKVATPILSAPAGNYQGSVEVSATGPAGATLRYTSDGSNPDTKANILTGSVLLKASGWFRVRSFATQADGTVLCSPSAEAQYTISASSLPQAPQVTPEGGTFKIPTTVSVIAPAGSDAYVSYDGYSYLPVKGDTLRIDRTETIFLRSRNRTDFLDGAIKTVNYVVDLDSATNGKSVTQAVSFGLPGGTYRSSQLVTLSCATAGATIRYSFATEPKDGDWIVYTAPILVEQTNRLVSLSAQASSSPTTSRSISPITKMVYFLQP